MLKWDNLSLQKSSKKLPSKELKRSPKFTMTNRESWRTQSQKWCHTWSLRYKKRLKDLKNNMINKWSISSKDWLIITRKKLLTRLKPLLKKINKRNNKRKEWWEMLKVSIQALNGLLKVLTEWQEHKQKFQRVKRQFYLSVKRQTAHNQVNKVVHTTLNRHGDVNKSINLRRNNNLLQIRNGGENKRLYQNPSKHLFNKAIHLHHPLLLRRELSVWD